MDLAIWLAWVAPLSLGAYSVGAVIVGADGRELSRGYSREGSDPHVHAEESALAKLGDPGQLPDGATLYSTLEPCSRRKSRSRSCTELILATRSPADSGTTRNNGITRVVLAWREPPLFVPDCRGVELLQQAGVAVTELTELAELARAPNRHLGV
jgi:diaminohydroxyphosphoribosylaminopyrimidine deaminase/5-amino-6-(5-phosphoribosylamino)uracil reductase